MTILNRIQPVCPSLYILPNSKHNHRSPSVSLKGCHHKNKHYFLFTTAVGLRHVAWHPVTEHTLTSTEATGSSKFTAAFSFVYNSFFSLSPSLAQSRDLAIAHASHISTATGSTKSTNQGDRCIMGANSANLGCNSSVYE